LAEYFPLKEHQAVVHQPMQATETDGKFDVYVLAHGGGLRGQADALRLGIARALQNFNMELRPTLKKEGYLTRDPRIHERKKYGRPGARKRFQFSKR
jgi:small subunit ribosomal protein S9